MPDPEYEHHNDARHEGERKIIVHILAAIVMTTQVSAPIRGSNTYRPYSTLSPVSANTTKLVAVSQWAKRSTVLKRSISFPLETVLNLDPAPQYEKDAQQDNDTKQSPRAKN